MQKGNTLIFLLIGIFILVGVAGGAFYLGKQNTPKPSPTPQSTSVTAPTQDATADWKIYTNTKYGFTFKIPQNYLTGECLDGYTILISTTQQGIECQKEPSGLSIKISNKDNTTNVVSLLKRDYSGTEKPITIDGGKGIQFEGTLASPAPLPNHVISTFFNKNSSFYQFNYDDYSDRAESNLYSQILSTFKFTN